MIIPRFLSFFFLISLASQTLLVYFNLFRKFENAEKVHPDAWAWFQIPYLKLVWSNKVHKLKTLAVRPFLQKNGGRARNALNPRY